MTRNRRSWRCRQAPLSARAWPLENHARSPHDILRTFRILRIPHPECSVVQEWCGSFRSCCTKAKRQQAQLLLRYPTIGASGVHCGTIRLNADATSCAVLSEAHSTGYAFLRTKSSGLSDSMPTSALRIRRAIFRRRFARQLFENAIELRQRLESDRESDFADP